MKYQVLRIKLTIKVDCLQEYAIKQIGHTNE